MSYQYFRNCGELKRKKFLAFEGAYHGDTFGSMSVSRGSGYHNMFEDLFFEVSTVPYPNTWIGDLEVEAKEKQSLRVLQKILDYEHQNIAAFIIEPLIQGASGMNIARASYLKKAINMAREYGILVIFDEVMTGFYRTGTMFAFEQIGAIPDFLCLSKGLSGGFLPLALTITSERVYEAFSGEADSHKTFLHGHSYTANPLGCAAALESLSILLESTTLESISNIHKLHSEMLPTLANDFRSVVKPRICGTLAAFCLDKVYPKARIQGLVRAALDNGILIRNLGHSLYFLPPYVISQDELSFAYDTISSLLEKID
jgi:adenosylmethionine-8-amino-7-oxononanoate aminotransferase